MMKAATIVVFALVAVSSGLVWFSGGANARAQAGNPYVSFHDFQTFDRNGEGARALRIPVYITLRSSEDRAMGLRLRLTATAPPPRISLISWSRGRRTSVC